MLVKLKLITFDIFHHLNACFSFLHYMYISKMLKSTKSA